jgi:hypothetical protein
MISRVSRAGKARVSRMSYIIYIQELVLQMYEKYLGRRTDETQVSGNKVCESEGRTRNVCTYCMFVQKARQAHTAQMCGTHNKFG